MTTRVFLVAAALAAVNALGTPTAARAQELAPFSVTNPAGAGVGSDALALPGQWLLVYVVPGSGPGDRLVQWLGENWNDRTAARVVFIASGQLDAARSYFLSKGGEALAANARWYVDPSGDAWRALQFQGTLGVAGMIDAKPDWKIDGVIQDPDVVRQPISKWIE